MYRKCILFHFFFFLSLKYEKTTLSKVEYYFKGKLKIFFCTGRAAKKARFQLVGNHVKLLHVYKSRRGFSKGTVLCGGDSPKLSSTGLATQIRRSEFIASYKKYFY